MNNFKGIKETTIPKGKQVVFELLNIVEDPINPGLKIIPRTQIPAKEVIYIDGEIQEIGAVLSTMPDGTHTLFSDIMFTPENGGRKILESGNTTDEIVYKLLKWSSFNATNPHRDPSKMAIFREVDAEKEEREREQLEENVIKAKGLIQNLNKEEIANLGKTFNVSGKSGLYKVAETQAQAILDIVETVAKAQSPNIIVTAIKKRKIIVDYVNKTIKFNNKPIYTFTGSEVDKKELADYLQENSPDIFEEIVASIS